MDARMYVDYTTDHVWARLRATRSEPPSTVSLDGNRRQTYVSSLEQSEQLLKAATTVNAAAQPLLIFYALSQAGRAIAAVAKSLKGDQWRLAGHGIHAADLRQPLPDIVVYPDKPGASGSFVRLSELLGSPLWGKPDKVSLGRLWDYLPENRQWPLVDNRNRRTPLYVEARTIFPEVHPLLSVPVCDFPTWLVDECKTKDDLDQYLTAYPNADRYDSYVRVSTDDSRPAFDPYLGGWGSLDMNWLVADGKNATVAEREIYLDTITRRYRGRPYFFPAMSPKAAALHPLLAWWSILYTLSMLARYQPAEWVASVNVDHCPHAVPIERLLATAIDIFPGLVEETISQVT